jgi:hypothetical protein
VDDGFNTANGSVAVNVRPQPYVNFGSPDTMVCVYDTITLDAGNPGASYQWSNGSTAQQIKVGSTGIGFDMKTFSVIVTNQEGCYSEDEITILFDFGACSGVVDMINSPFVILYPNPGKGKVVLQTDRGYDNAVVSILDPIGRVLSSMEYQSDAFDDRQIMLNMDHLKNGIYYVRFQVHEMRPVMLKYIMTR